MRNSASSGNKAARSPLPTLLAVGLVALLGCAALQQATLGFRVVSTEDGRRLEIENAPRSIPFARLDLPSQPLFADFLRADGRVAIVAFIYTSCNAVCAALGSEFQQMQASILARGLQDKVRLVSISFDPRDSPQRWASYALRQHADAGVWQFAGIAAGAERQAVLDSFGIVVVPAPLGEFVHNAAFHVVGADGRLAKIDDFDNPGQALADALSIHAAGRK